MYPATSADSSLVTIRHRGALWDSERSITRGNLKKIKELADRKKEVDIGSARWTVVERFNTSDLVDQTLSGKWANPNADRLHRDALENFFILGCSVVPELSDRAMEFIKKVNVNSKSLMGKIKIEAGEGAARRYRYVLHDSVRGEMLDLGEIDPVKFTADLQATLNKRFPKPDIELLPFKSTGVEVNYNAQRIFRWDSYQPGKDIVKILLNLLGLDASENKMARAYFLVIMTLPSVPDLMESVVAKLNNCGRLANVRFFIEPHPDNPDVMCVMYLFYNGHVGCLRQYHLKQVFKCNEAYCARYLMVSEAERMLAKAIREQNNIKEFEKAEKTGQFENVEINLGDYNIATTLTRGYAVPAFQFEMENPCVFQAALNFVAEKNPQKPSLDFGQKSAVELKSGRFGGLVTEVERVRITAEDSALTEKEVLSQPRVLTRGSVYIGRYSRADITRERSRLSQVLQLLTSNVNTDLNKYEVEKHLSVIIIQPCIPSLIEASVSRLNELTGNGDARLIIRDHANNTKLKCVMLLLDGEEDCLLIYDKRRVFTCNKEYCAEYLGCEKMTADPENMTAEQMVYNALRTGGNIKAFKDAECEVTSSDRLFYGGLAGGCIGTVTGAAGCGLYPGGALYPGGVLCGGGLGFVTGAAFCMAMGSAVSLFDTTINLPAYNFEVKD